MLKSRSSSSSSFFHPHNCYSVLSLPSFSNYFLSSTLSCVVEIIHGFNTANILELTLQDITTLVFQKQTTPPFAYILACLQMFAFESEWSKKNSGRSAVYRNVGQSPKQSSPFLTFCCPCIAVYLSQHLTNLMHKICFTISFISCLYMFRAHVLIIRTSKLHYTASGIITPIGGRLDGHL